MKFSICVGGLRYNIDCLTEQFYEKNGRMFEVPHSEDAYNIQVTMDKLKAFQFYDDELSIYVNETAYILDCVIKHCLDYNRMMIHGAAIRYNGRAYLFVAPSGTGKTTHVGLWKEYIAGVEIINGDKPMLTFDDEIKVCGSPWNGKEYLGGNLSAPLGAIIVLKQGSTNVFNKLNAKDAVVSLLKQCFYSIDKVCGPKVVSYIGKIVNAVPVFSLECDISKEALDACYNGLHVYMI